MFFKTALVSVFTLMAANQAVGAAVPRDDDFSGPHVLIATDSYYACNCPNNCDYVQGTSCKYLSGPSSGDSYISGTCAYPNGSPSSSLTCVG